jgi:phosphoribosyl 1,2-cyclic phosphodiesterase
MALQITSLNSGSNGNCYYIGNDKDAVLVDAGITCKETEKRMQGLGLSMQKIRAIFISHEHSDHIKGLTVLASRYNLPVYISQKTLQHSRLQLNPQNICWINQDDAIKIESLTIRAFKKRHDAADPHSFTIESDGICVGVFTDIGAECKNLAHHFKRCHAAFLEANYDEEMLDNGSYPFFLKNRIRGGFGHLSNRQALDLFKTHRPKFMSHLLLSHLSKDNNCPHLVQKLFEQHCCGTNIIVASRFNATNLYNITSTAQLRKNQLAQVILQPVQMSLFS